MTRGARAGGLVRVLGWVALLAGSILALGALGRGALSTPPFTGGLAALRSWASTRDAATILMTGVRIAGRLLASYLLASTVLATLARATRWAAAVRFADAVALPPIRRLASGTAGLLVVAGPLAGPMGAHTLAPAGGGPAAVLLAGPTVAPAAGAPVVSAPVPVAGPTVAPAGAPVISPPVHVVGPTAAAPAGGHSDDEGGAPTLGLLRSGPADPAPETWTVRPGDSLWVIAASVLRTTWGRAPTDEETGRYWVVVVEVNRPRLGDPANANLLFPGQEMTVPPPPVPSP